MSRKFHLLVSVLAFSFVLIIVSLPLSARAQNNDWDSIKISPESGNWNFPGHFILKASKAVTVSWLIKCTDGGCGRPNDSASHTFSEGEQISVGWGHQCYRWQLDPVGRTGFIADAEPELCAKATTPPDTATPIPPSPTDTPIPPSPTATSVGPGQTPAPTATPTLPTNPQPTNTPDKPRNPKPTPTQEGVLLPVTGEVPPASPFASPLWPALAALILLGLAGHRIWAGILQAGTVQVTTNLYPSLRSQAWKALILILVSLLILAFAVLPSIIRQTELDFGRPASYNPLPQALVQELPKNIGIAPVEQALPLKVGTSSLAFERLHEGFSQPLSPGERNTEVQSSAMANQAKDRTDSSPVSRLVIPALEVDSSVRFIPFENHTWDIQALGMDIAWLGNTSSPGQGSNTVLAAHYTLERLGHGPFHEIKYLKPGDVVYVYTDKKVYSYSVRDQAVVAPDDSSVVVPTDQPQLTLLTCARWDAKARKYTNRQAVFADLVGVATISMDKNVDMPMQE